MANSKSKSAGSVSLTQQAYDEIRRQILSGELPAAAPLSEHQLAKDLNLSRTPVREAIKRLENELLVHSIPARGTFVAELTARDISEIYQVRERLESLAARIAADKMSPADLQYLENEIATSSMLARNGRQAEIVESDIRLHKRIIAATHNSRLIVVLATLDDQMYRVRALFPQSAAWLQATLEEHAKIVACIKAKDGSGAEQAMSYHLRSAREYAIRCVLPAVDIGIVL